MAVDDRERFQHDIARTVLAELGEDGFALAGGGAVKAHGLSDRPTDDVDIFCQSPIDEELFQSHVDRALNALGASGYTVEIEQRVPLFVRVNVEQPSGLVCHLDFAVNWRSEPPVIFEVGPVVSERDSVAGKLAALYSRAEPRDFVDVGRVRAQRRYTDDELLEIARSDDPGFEATYFAGRLAHIRHLTADDVAEYEVSAEEFEQIQRQTMSWALELIAEHNPPTG
ncbi:MAG: nucleotidyl transferase AbiEii/AbiGii toxin family protein [Aeromicrobium sp.]|uniref:nucleotidyl transferase AbiEii/AbiGii toxin family protein n=1 Tax=Aeromicrobium sp. TaxID=1871063 RepID=UPI0039E54F08